jgi:mannose-6-phosphate isomerase-like protein (cupin superfamily)
VVQGEAEFVVNGETCVAREGEALRMEPQDRHDILNKTHAPLKLIFIKCPYLPKDKISL